MTRVSQLWDLIETWGFRVDIKNIVANNANDANNANYNDGNGKSKKSVISDF